MNSSLSFSRFLSPSDEGWPEALALYLRAFPARERRNEADLRAALADPAFHACAIRLDGAAAGILFYWEYDGGSYVEYLAVEPEFRGRQVGSRALGAFCRGRNVVLEIEPPEEPSPTVPPTSPSATPSVSSSAVHPAAPFVSSPASPSADASAARELPQSLRRLHFYERAGFVRNPQPYLHPSYGDPAEPHPLVLMSRPGPLGDEALRRFERFIRERVLRYSRLGQPVGPLLTGGA